MKTVRVVLIATGFLLLCALQGDAKRFILEDVTRGEEAGVAINNGSNSATGNSEPPTVVEANSIDNKSINDSKQDNSNSMDEKNDSYHNASGSSTESHHIYVTDRPPKKNS